MRVLSIDAWGNSKDGFEWNNWHNVGFAPAELRSASPRVILKWMRDNGYLQETSAGKCTTEDDQYNIVILDARSREPLFALEYGALQS